ncbi:putative aldouronate transport system substrate-binding protein [Alkalibacterium putridalgicola]|uniref:Putative aldouronate transport system substrate-binding protein n=1 Tax=Alkalibacterium putridalgicola TaxID=426703 RepID=A0A1H7RBA8_9LACT|nr:extracellular solute-binding protein [Alkalibacterium putridalgicola]GEK88829.1 sugar ABC transporter substrate-binding protein [Alkalibacterium putridalgicola]SEL57452.1 putative aldouronate transport system substrate-binding protein [Alkalibacterium putridalgicola]
MKLFNKNKFVLMATLCSGLLLAACSTETESTDSEEEITTEDIGNKGAMEDFKVGDTFVATEPLEIGLFYRDLTAYPYDPDWEFFNVLEEEHNVTFDVTSVPLSDFEERRSVTIAAGDMPDIITDSWPGVEDPFVASGAILPISDYVHLMPHYQKRLDEWDLHGQVDNLRYLDGKYYVLPGLNEDVHFDFSMKYNKTVFDEYGIEEPQSWEELRSALEVLRDETGETPMTLWWQGDSMFSFAGPSFDTVGGWGFGDGTMYDEENDEFIYGPMQQGYRDMVEYYAGLVEDGLLNPEAFTQDGETTEKQLVNLESFVSSGQAGTMASVNEGLRDLHGEGEYEFVRMPMLEGPAGPKVSGARLVSGIMLNSAVAERDDFLAVLQYIDWLYYSDEGNEFAQWGIEGETYEKTDEVAGGFRPLDNISFETMNSGADEDLQEDYGFGNVAFAFAGNAEIRQSIMDEQELEYQQTMNAEREFIAEDPPYPMSQADQEQAALLSTPLKDTVDQYTLRFITGQYSLDRWDEFIADLENQNVEGYLELVNEAYQEFQETLEEVE